VLRIKLYDLIRQQIRFTANMDQHGHNIAGQWSRILYDAHIEFFEEMPEDFSRHVEVQTQALLLRSQTCLRHRKPRTTLLMGIPCFLILRTRS
jgi:hypothetical protein